MTFNSELEKILEIELELLRKLDDFASRKSDLIIANNIEQLEILTKREEDLINEMGSCELAREKMLDEWGVAKGTPISTILEKLPGEKAHIEQLRQELIEVMDRLKFKNEANHQLIRDNLDWIDFNINLMTNASVETNYGQESSSVGGKSLFDRKV